MINSLAPGTHYNDDIFNDLNQSDSLSCISSVEKCQESVDKSGLVSSVAGVEQIFHTIIPSLRLECKYA